MLKMNTKTLYVVWTRANAADTPRLLAAFISFAAALEFMEKKARCGASEFKLAPVELRLR